MKMSYNFIDYVVNYYAVQNIIIYIYLQLLVQD